MKVKKKLKNEDKKLFQKKLKFWIIKKKKNF